MRFDLHKLTAALFLAAMIPTAACEITKNQIECTKNITTRFSDLMSDGNYTRFVDTLKNQSGDFLGILKAGDNKINGDVVDIKNEALPVHTLRATQNEIGLSDSLLFAINPAKATNGAIENSSKFILDILNANNSTILRPNNLDIIVAGNDIIDGHHRWSTIVLLNPQANIGTFNIYGTDNAIEALKITQSAILATKGVLPSSSKRGKNMLTMNPVELYDFINENISDVVMNDLMTYWKLNNQTQVKDKLYDTILTNLKVLRIKNVNSNFDIPRSYMPQTDNEGNWYKALTTGNVNVRTPYGGRKSAKKLKTRSKKRTTKKRKSAKKVNTRSKKITTKKRKQIKK